VATSSAVATNDVIFAIQSNDFFLMTDLLAPTGGPGGWAQNTDASADGGSNLAHIKVWWTVVSTGGIQTVTFNFNSDGEEKAGALLVVPGADTANPFDGTPANASGTASTSLVAPSVSPPGADSLLFNVWTSGGGSSTASFTDPSSPWARQYTIQNGGLSQLAGREALTASGATGTRTATAASAVPWAAVSFAIKAATGGGATARPFNPLVAPMRAAHRAAW
jgi:hypothetical protein